MRRVAAPLFLAEQSNHSHLQARCPWCLVGVDSLLCRRSCCLLAASCWLLVLASSLLQCCSCTRGLGWTGPLPTRSNSLLLTSLPRHRERLQSLRLHTTSRRPPVSLSSRLASSSILLEHRLHDDTTTTTKTDTLHLSTCSRPPSRAPCSSGKILFLPLPIRQPGTHRAAPHRLDSTDGACALHLRKAATRVQPMSVRRTRRN